MKTFHLKNLALVSTLVLGLAVMPYASKAADTIDASIETLSAITALNTADMNFGNILLQPVNGEVPTMTMDAVLANGTGALTGNDFAESHAQSLDGGTGVNGAVTVDIPLGSANTILQMQVSDPGLLTPGAGGTASALQMTAITYATAIQGDNQAIAFASPEPVTVVTGGTPQLVKFGGTISALLVPADATYTTSFTASFAY